MHKQHKMFVPEMIFGHLLTGSNYNDEEKKVVGGRNGYGAKLANIFSKKFIVECGDKDRKKTFKMVWRDNMKHKGEALINDNFKGRDYTKVTFYPDWKILNMEGMTKDLVALLKKRVYDMAGILPKVKTTINGNEI